LFVSYSNYDYYVITETRLNSEILDNELRFLQYNIFRTDRGPHNSNCSRGGGIMICVHNKYHSEIISILDNCIEQLFVLIKLNNKIKYIIGTCYIPSGKLVSSYLFHIQTIENILSKYNNNVDILLVEDYNLPGSTFTNDNTGLVLEGVHSVQAQIIFDSSSLLNLYQLNNTEHLNGSILDLVFTNISNLVVHNELNSLFKIDSYHPYISMVHYYSDNIKNYKNNDKTLFNSNFKHADFQAKSLALGLFVWNILIGSVNIDLAIFNFYETLYCIIDKFVPKYYVCKNKFHH
jgi:hypothetical protein